MGRSLPSFSIPSLQKALMGWYARHQRHLPWRETKNPYKIWLSEIMLQQTQVQTVIPYYLRFLEKFPDLKSVADVETDELLKAWAGLGYYNRIRQFQKAAMIVCTHLDGRIPTEKEALKKLPGLGDYTSAAIASIAFGKPVAVVDGNVIRVLSRIFAYKEEIRTSQSKLWFQTRADQLLEPSNPGDFNQAMMELGATVCLTDFPKCLTCPVAQSCRGKTHPQSYPVNTKRPKSIQENSFSVVLAHAENFLLYKREEGDVLGGMWEFPRVLSPTKPLNQDVTRWAKSFGEISPRGLPLVTHSIMNRRMRVYPFLCLIKKQKALKKHCWIAKDQLKNYPLTTLTQKILKKIDELGLLY